MLLTVEYCSISSGNVLETSSEVVLDFDLMINSTSVNENTIYIEDPDGNKAGDYNYTVDGFEVVFYYLGLVTDTSYTLVVEKDTVDNDGIKDLSNNTLTEDYLIDFTTVAEETEQVDYEKTTTDEDISDKDTKIFKSTKEGVKYLYAKKDFDGTVTLQFDNLDTLSSFLNIVEINVEDVYLNEVPTYVFYNKVDDYNIDVEMYQMDGSELPYNTMVTFDFDEKQVKYGNEMIFFTKLHPKPISLNIIKHKMGSALSSLAKNNFKSLYIDLLLEFDSKTKSNYLSLYLGCEGEKQDASNIKSWDVIKVNELSFLQSSNSVLTIDKDSGILDSFRLVFMMKTLEYLIFQLGSYDEVSVDGMSFSYNTSSLQDMLEYYKKQLQEKMLKAGATKATGPRVAIRGSEGGINRRVIWQYRNILSARNVFR